MPLEIGRLTCLRTLKFFNVGEEHGRQIEELGSLKRLRGKLEIHSLQRVSGTEAARSAKLFEKEDIYKLEFGWMQWGREGIRNDEDVLEGLQPHPNLKSLSILGYLGDKFPTWLMSMAVSIDDRGGLMRLNNLVEIRLMNCIRCEHVPMLGHLPLLCDLRLYGMEEVKCISTSFYGDHNNFYSIGSASNTVSGGNESIAIFPALVTFDLHNMSNLLEWTEAAVTPATRTKAPAVIVFPRLLTLTIHDCPVLTTIPANFPSLEKLSFKNCPKLTTGPYQACKV